MNSFLRCFAVGLRGTRFSVWERRSAFSLIELLVALAIVVILAAILVPAVSRARVSPLQAKNTMQLRQVGAALQLFAAEHNGQLPQYGYPAVNTRGPYVNSSHPVRALFPEGDTRLGTAHPLGGGDYLGDIDVLYSPLLSKFEGWHSNGDFYSENGSRMIGYFVHSLPSGVVNGRNPVRYNNQLMSNESIGDWGRSPIYSDFTTTHADEYGFRGDSFFVLHVDGSVSSRDAAITRRLYLTNIAQCYYYMATAREI